MPTETFTAGTDTSWTVPDGVDLVTIKCYGGSGANGGGNGGFVQGDLVVSPGDTLYIKAGEGASGQSGAWPGGANGGSASASTFNYSASATAGGGGGYSDVRYQGNALDDRVIVAGGGGGGGDSDNDAADQIALSSNAAGGGDGDGSSGGDSGPADGGLGGTTSDDTGNSGGDSSGTFESPEVAAAAAGGGGGGGYRGGGGGGSSIQNDGQDTYGAGGGGGSRYTGGVSNVQTDTHNNSDGEVVFEYTVTPLPPSDLTVTYRGDVTIDLTWQDNSAIEDGFEVQRREEGGTFSTIATLSANTESYTDTNITVGTTYEYRVRATYTDSDSSYTNTISELAAAKVKYYDGSSWVTAPVQTHDGSTWSYVKSVSVFDGSTWNDTN